MIASLRLGGAERQLAGLACMLRGQNYDVEVLTYREGDFYSDSLASSGVPHVKLPPRGGELKLIRTIANHLKESKCDVLISFLAGTNIKACLVKRLCPGLRLIVSERNFNTSCRIHDRIRFCLYRRFADQIVCNSYSQTEFIRTHAPSLQGRLYTIPNFTDLERFQPDAEGSEHSGEPFRVVTTARLAPRKNAVGLIRAAALCPGMRFDWYGADTEDRYSRKCRSLIGKLGLVKRFFIHPSNDEPESVYAGADAFCLPSFYEGTPNSLAEALACGLPAVCSRVSDNAKYISEGINGFLFDPSAPSALAEALKQLSSFTQEQLSAARARSRHIAESSFNKDIFIQRYLELLQGPRTRSREA